ncbi:hypothetical protein JCM10213_002240 [Rhodosporidiobolus nylandii]
MDTLDGNLHASLLAALAANLASSPSTDDISLLTASVDELVGSLSSTNGQDAADEGAGQTEVLTQADVDSLTAFLSYASSPTLPEPAAEKAAEKVLAVLPQLSEWDVEVAVGAQAMASHPPSSLLSSSLTSAALSLAALLPSHRAALLSALFTAHSTLLSALSTAEPARIVSYLLPALEGFTRAVRGSNFIFTTNDAPPVFELREGEAGKVAAALGLPWTPDSEDGRAVLATLEVYRSAPSSSSSSATDTISPSTPLISRLALQEAYFSSRLTLTSSSTSSPSSSSRWGTLLASRPSAVATSQQEKAQAGEVAERAMKIWEETVGKVERAERARQAEAEDGGEGSGEVDGASEVLSACLRLATLTSLLCTPTSSLLPTLQSLLHPSSTSLDPSLQVTALEALQLLGTRFATVRDPAEEAVKAFVLSGALRSEDDGEVGPVATAATRAWASLIAAAPNASLARNTALQSLLNYLASSEREGYGEGDAGREKENAAAHAALVAAGLAKESGEVELIDITLTTLSYHLTTTPSLSILSSILSSLVLLSPLLPSSQFSSLLRTVCSVAPTTSSASSGAAADEDEQDGAEQKYAAVLTALSRLAEVAAGKKEEDKEEGEAFLKEVLGVFARVAGGMRGRGEKVGLDERAAALLSLAPILSTYLRLTNSTHSTHYTSATCALFRQFWVTCLLSGFLSPSSPQTGRGGWGRLSEWQQDALRSVALRCPPLTAGVGEELVEMFAALDGVVKAGGHAVAIDTLRADLSSTIPSQSSAARSLPASHALFLSAVMRVETLRSEAGSLSPFFGYLALSAFSPSSTSPGTAKETATAGEVLKSIGDKVLSIFSSRLSRAVTAHDLQPEAYREIREVLLYTTHTRQTVRETAGRYLDNLLSSFPSLVCDLGVVTVMLELLTVLRRACLAEFTDEYTPVYEFHSARGSFTLTLSDDYPLRNRILRTLHQSVRAWLLAGITRSPLEMHALLQEYIDVAGEGYRSQMTSVAEEEMGKSVAIELAKTPASNGKFATLPAWGNWNADASSSFARTFASKSFFGGEASLADANPADVLVKLETLAKNLDHHKLPYKLPELRDLFYRGAASLVKAPSPDFSILHLVVSLPVRLFTEASIAVGQEVWTWVADARPELEPRIVAEVLEAWAGTVEHEQGLFSHSLNPHNPLNEETQFTPTDKDALSREYLLANRVFAPMLAMLEFLSSRFQAFRYRNAELVYASLRLVFKCLQKSEAWSTHPLSRELRFRFLSFGFCILQGSLLESVAEYNIRAALYDALLQWFSSRPLWSFGSNRIQLKSDLQAIDELLSAVSADAPAFDSIASASDVRASSLPGRISISAAREHHRLRQTLVKHLLTDEADRLRLWLNPLQDSKRGPMMSGEVPAVEELRKLARFAWVHWSQVVVFLPERFKAPPLAQEVTRLVRADPERVQNCPEALAYFIDGELTPEAKAKLRHLLFWAPAPVPSALRFLQPKYSNDPILLQYAVRVLEHHPVEVTFFYIPQVVQALRTDDSGLAERFIFETSKISQHFCHQIIWNMKANAYRGDDAEEPDPMKPTLDRMVDMIVESLSGEAKEFYQREFSFFEEVTSISGKLKPYIKKSKPEKKAKIDEEMEKIKVDQGVYLPSNPDGVVVDINRKSGRPLQSHAKAPFMATFKVRRTRKKVTSDDLEAQDALIDVEDAENAQKEEYDTWQSAIFKVGDDCRQDMLALQIIAIHKNVFSALGLDLLVTPYRVTATGAGCGVIDVVPNATSRDEMGRAKINDLQSFFVMKYGPTDSVEFQRARTNFIQSMAAYSLLCYIVQIKDRHNGNIMVDSRGCITHIDFGFLFDIGPGGVKFEPNSFKLSHEMVVLMGGRDSVGFRQFRELTVKAFLSARAYAQSIVDTTHLMLAAEFPSFKGEGTIDRLKGRFRLDLSEKDAARFMVDIINDACENKRSIVYDEFQRVTNGIPYTR